MNCDSSLLEDCQCVIAKGHESWKSYFSKWERFAKYEENIPEKDLLNETEKEIITSKKKKKTRRSHQTKNSKTSSSVLLKKGLRNRKKTTKKKRICKEENKGKVTEDCTDLKEENLIEDLGNMQLEAVLKTVVAGFLKANKSEFQMLSVLSQTFSVQEVTNCSPFFQQPQLLPGKNDINSLQSITNLNIKNNLICPDQSIYVGSIIKNLNLFEFNLKPVMESQEWGASKNLNKSAPNLKINLHEPKFLFPERGSQTPNPTTQINFRIGTDTPVVMPNMRVENTKLKSLEWNSSPGSPNSVCRKINKEYFIKRSFLKMNVAQDGKRFRNLCLRKRTNSVTLSMENSNFITPERKSPERKCFSENVLQRKRRRPSKLFFGNEEEDSESDDQSETHAPVIRCKNKKPRTQIITEAPESDSDDCKSIFDRINVA